MSIRPILRSRLTRFLALTAVLVMAATQHAAAQGNEADGKWRFSLSPYLLLPYMSGITGVGDLTQEVNASPGDIFSKLQFGGMLLVEAHNGTWGVALDGIYMDLEQSGTSQVLPDRISWTVGMQQGVVELAGFRRLTGWAEVVLGGRWNSLGSDITIETVLAGTRSQSADETWFDPFVGARLHVPGTGKWNLVFRGDVGGFGVGSDFTWQVYPKVGYRFSKLFELQAAYRAMSIDYTRDISTRVSDASVPFVYDMRTFGPEFGMVFHF
jgi:hypothetical protein